MFQSIAVSLTAYSVRKSWIDPSKAPWCEYAVQKWLGMGLFLLLSAVVAALTRQFAAVLIFIAVLLLFRRRLGGWHAKRAWTCQVLSVGLVVCAALLAPMLGRADLLRLTAALLALCFATAFLRPCYPDRANFTEDVKRANNKRKNILLLGVGALAVAGFLCGNRTFAVSGIFGLTIADFSVLLEYTLKRRREKHEKLG